MKPVDKQFEDYKEYAEQLAEQLRNGDVEIACGRVWQVDKSKVEQSDDTTKDKDWDYADREERGREQDNLDMRGGARW